MTTPLAVLPASLESVEPKVVQSDREGVTVEITFPEPTTASIYHDGAVWGVLRIPGLGPWDGIGWPQVPVHTIQVGIPPDVSVVLTAEPLASRQVDTPPLVPVPRPVPRDDDRSQVDHYVIEPVWPPDQSSLYPASWAQLEGISWIRNRRVALVRVHPVRTRPGVSGCSFAPALRVRLSFVPESPSHGRTAIARYGDDPFDFALDRRLVNGPQSQDWLRSESVPPPRPAAGDYFSSSAVWIKLATRGEGIVRVSADELREIGASLPIEDARSIRVFVGPAFELPPEPPAGSLEGWMREVPIVVEDGGDGRFEADLGDRIEFYAMPVDGYRNDLDAESADSSFYAHQYTSERVYWLTWGSTLAGDGRRMPIADATPAAAFFLRVGTITERVHVENDTYYDPSPREDGQRWEKWWWNPGYRRLDFAPRPVPFELPAHRSGTPSELRVRFWGVTTNGSANGPGFLDHMVDLELNGVALPRQEWNGRQRHDIELAFDAASDPLLASNVLTIRVHPDPDPQNPERQDTVYLAYLELTHRRFLRFGPGDLAFRGLAAGGVVRYRITGVPDLATEIYDVTDPVAPIRLTTGSVSGADGDMTLEFERTEDPTLRRRYLVTHPSRRDSVAWLASDPPPAGGEYLRERMDPVDYVIIHHDDFADAARALADFRRTHVPGSENPQVLAASLADVYDEFSFGLPDPTAIRNFLKFAYEHYRDPAAPESPRLRYAVLLGDAHYDLRGRQSGGFNFVPSWWERWDGGLWIAGFEATFPSDDYFGLLDGPDEWGMEIAIGRLPAKTPLEAHGMVEKTIACAEPVRSEWQTRAILAADDLCQGRHYDYLGWSHTLLAEELAAHLPGDTEINRIYLVDFPDPETGVECLGVQKPSARDALIEAVDAGAWLFDYVGHGGARIMADEHFLTITDLPLLRNEGRNFTLIAASCTVGDFDEAGDGLAEALVKLPANGAANAYCAAAEVGATAGGRVNTAMLNSLLDAGDAGPNGRRTLGEAAVLARLEVPRGDHRKYNLLGDPADVPPWPRYDCRLALLGANPDGGAPVPTDTLWRGEALTLRGTVIDPNTGATVEVDGTARVHVLDAEEIRSRDGPLEPVSYPLLGPPLHRALAPVRNGEFAMDFVMPIDVGEGDRGRARIAAFVESDIAPPDAHGALTELRVADEVRPGMVVVDDEGPAITFAFAGPTDAVPAGSAVSVRLEDAQGIYIAPHDATQGVRLTIEDLEGSEVFSSDLSSDVVYDAVTKTADVEIALPASLLPGLNYRMTAAASDNLGNRASAEEVILIVQPGSSHVQRTFVYPNPARESTSLFVDVGVLVNVRVRIYTITGHLIRTLEAVLPAGGGLTHPLTWDLRDEDGDAVANGSYPYAMEVRSPGGERLHRSRGWIAVLR